MKRRFFECALLLGIVMSVMFLAQTPDGIGHNNPNEEGGEPHQPPGHTHNPSILVDPVTGEDVTTGGEDPRGNHYSGTCGQTEHGYQQAWGFLYGGGTYADSPHGPDYDTQNVWSLSVDTVASTGSKSARVVVTPSIYLVHYDKKSGSWQGSGEGTVTFSGVNFHRSAFHSGCYRYSRGTDTWSKTGRIDLDVKNAEITEGEKKTYGGGVTSSGINMIAESEHTYTTKYNDLQARGWRFILELKAGFFDSIATYQDKDATGSGHLMDKQVQSDSATAEYRWTRWKPCYCGESKEPKRWFE